MSEQHKNYKGYFFVNNLYMSEKQYGIQSFHCLGEIVLKYMPVSDVINRKVRTKYNHLLNWLKNDKTAILLKGHNCANLNKIKEFLNDKDNPYPWSYFCEDEESLNSAITSVGVVLPECIHNAPRDDDLFYEYAIKENLTIFEIELSALIINSKSA